MMGTGLALGLVARAPVPGRCKTRLARAIGPIPAARLYEAMLRDSLDSYARIPARRHVLLAAPEDDGVAALRVLAPPAWEIEPQVGEDLGERLAHAMRSLGAHGDAVVLAGSDSPMVPFDAIEIGVGSLAAPRNAIVGPAADGGYYLIGVSETQPGVLEGIRWSTSVVFEQTVERCADLGLAVTRLPPSYDVDEPADLERLRRDVHARPDRAPHVAAFLRDGG
jgi:rSAM/selenodomain-associated transferase 1